MGIESSDLTRQNVNNMVSNATNMNYEGANYNRPDSGANENINISSPASSAIQSRANQKFYNPEQENQMRQLSSVQRQSNQIATAENEAAGQYRIDSAAYNSMMQRQAQENQQRAALLGSLFGIAGAVGGMAVGGPPGALVGADVGGMGGGRIGQGMQ